MKGTLIIDCAVRNFTAVDIISRRINDIIIGYIPMKCDVCDIFTECNEVNILTLLDEAEPSLIMICL